LAFYVVGKSETDSSNGGFNGDESHGMESIKIITKKNKSKSPLESITATLYAHFPKLAKGKFQGNHPFNASRILNLSRDGFKTENKFRHTAYGNTDAINGEKFDTLLKNNMF